jgi:hypothetical protein
MQLPIATTDGTRLVPVYYVERGLAVERLESFDHHDWRPRWGVLHVASGQRVGGPLSTRVQARTLQQTLLTLPLDWTEAATEAWLTQVRPLAGPVVRAYCAGEA